MPNSICGGNYFQFGTVNSSNFDIFLTDVKTYNTPKCDVTFLRVEGRDGDLILDNHRWNNVTIRYGCAIATDFSDRFDGFKRCLLGQKGYQRIEDSIDTQYFRMGVLDGVIEPETMRRNKTGKFNVSFSCKPQRFLKRGESTIQIQEPTVLYNDYGFPAKPLITVYGSGAGELYVGGQTVVVKALDGCLTLDCDSMNAYRKVGDAPAENKNNTIFAPEFPELSPGETGISWTGGITKVDIIPRWWTL